MCKGDYNKSRHTLYHKKGREYIDVNIITLGKIIKDHPEINSIKMDIECSEIDILEHTDFSLYPNIKKKMVFEYSFDIDPSIPRFMQIINKLKENFKTVRLWSCKKNL